VTALINRREMQEVLSEHAALSKRKMLTFSLAYIDLDHFKASGRDQCVVAVADFTKPAS
jgi:GGDEF domain-containing protein